MKNITLLLLVLISTYTVAQETVSLDSISKYEGKLVTLCDSIIDIYQTKTDKKVTYLNFGKSYPNHVFTVVIFKNVLERFSYNPLLLKGKTICVSGRVVIYKNKPQIVITEESDIIVQ